MPIRGFGRLPQLEYKGGPTVDSRRVAAIGAGRVDCNQKMAEWSATRFP